MQLEKYVEGNISDKDYNVLFEAYILHRKTSHQKSKCKIIRLFSNYAASGKFLHNALTYNWWIE